MKKISSQLEDLPNELLTDIFKYLDARDLFRSFSNLNFRLDRLIRSFDYLQLHFHLHTTNATKINEEPFPFYVYSLLVDPWININLHRFQNVRRLKLNSPLPHILEQLKPESMPFLEYLSVSYIYNMYEIVLLHDKIFSNRFQHLSACELLENESPMTIQHWQPSPSIRTLKIELIDAEIFSIILSACPNLSVLKFSMLTKSIPSKMGPIHLNLERIVVELRDSDWLFDDLNFSQYLVCVPNLKRLEILRRRYPSHIDQYDWFHTIRKRCLPSLLDFSFSIQSPSDDSNFALFDERLQQTFQQEFLRLHSDLNFARLKFH